MKEYKYKINGNTYNVGIGDIVDNVAEVLVNGMPYKVELEKKQGPVSIVSAPRPSAAPRTATGEKVVSKPNVSAGGFQIKAPLPGTILSINVKVGDTVDFTVAADVPHAAAGWDAYPFTITDIASKGLRIAETSDFKVQFRDHTTVNPDLYTITQEGNAQSGTTTTIYFADATTLAGRTIVVSYQGTVTKDALDGLSGSVDNKATITTKDGTSGEGKTVLKTYGFQFTKIGKEGNEAKPLAGAKFVVKNAEGKFLKQAEDGAWSFVSDQNDAKTFTTENDGLVKVAGLAAGTYTVVETQAPTGYAQNFRVTFNVKITDEGLITFEPDALRQVQPVNNTTANATATVLNVKSVTQLPLTGAAGTVLFTVVALLVGGAGVAVAVKSRRRTY